MDKELNIAVADFEGGEIRACLYVDGSDRGRMDSG